MPETEDLYEILHLHPSAHPDVIQAAYRRLALLYHPDKNPSPEATEMMAAVNRAYAVLSDPGRRTKYDQSRAAQTRSGGASASATSSSQASRPRTNTPRNPTGYFAIGSTRDEVAQVQGNPPRTTFNRRLARETWYYGRSKVEFSMASGLCQNWYNLGGNLRVQARQGSNITSSDFFTFGSHKDDVARLQGSPQRIEINRSLDRETWTYVRYVADISIEDSVHFSFREGLVEGWDGGRSLKVRVEPGFHISNLDFFTHGSHKDDIARLHGTPNKALIKRRMQEETWQYPGGAVDFHYPSGLVKLWYGNGLKTRKKPPPSSGYSSKRPTGNSSPGNSRPGRSPNHGSTASGKSYSSGRPTSGASSRNSRPDSGGTPPNSKYSTRHTTSDSPSSNLGTTSRPKLGVRDTFRRWVKYDVCLPFFRWLKYGVWDRLRM